MYCKTKYDQQKTTINLFAYTEDGDGNEQPRERRVNLSLRELRQRGLYHLGNVIERVENEELRAAVGHPRDQGVQAREPRAGLQ